MCDMIFNCALYHNNRGVEVSLPFRSLEHDRLFPQLLKLCIIYVFSHQSEAIKVSRNTHHALALLENSPGGSCSNRTQDAR